jgi:hypothetical protein
MKTIHLPSGDQSGSVSSSTRPRWVSWTNPAPFGWIEKIAPRVCSSLK